MLNRYLAITFQAAGLLLGGVLLVILLNNFIEWLQTGRWESVSLLRAAYDANLLKARWFLSVDWGWRIHELLGKVPLLAVLGTLVPVLWGVGVFFSRR